jgi:NAD+ diphosphatase
VRLPSFDTFIPGNDEPAAAAGHALWLVIRGADLLVQTDDGAIGIPSQADIAPMSIPHGAPHFLGSLDGVSCRAVSAPAEAVAPPGWVFTPVRSLFGRISDSFFSVIARALEIVEWEKDSRFCGRCGSATAPRPGERARECPSCGHLDYPRISPAVIMAVVRDDTLLLARARRFPAGFYSVLAGFVEPGETLEECVAREVMEETGIGVRNVRYFRSQPWPFPHSLMVAFTAEHASGEIRIDPSEILDAGWYKAGALPSIPDPLTVARKLIDWFVSMRTEVAT